MVNNRTVTMFMGIIATVGTIILYPYNIKKLTMSLFNSCVNLLSILHLNKLYIFIYDL